MPFDAIEGFGYIIKGEFLYIFYTMKMGKLPEMKG